jgi:hypothetical protein
LRKEVTGDLRKLHSDDVHDLYFVPDIIRVMTSRGGEGGWECGTDMENFMTDSFINLSISQNFIFHSHHLTIHGTENVSVIIRDSIN